MANEVEYVARIQSRRLAQAFRRTNGTRLRLLQTPAALAKYVEAHPQPAVWIHEVGEESEPQAELWFNGANYYISVKSRQRYTLRSPCPTVLMVDTPGKLAARVHHLIDDLARTASRRIIAVKPTGRQRLSVTFLDGQTFEAKLEPHQLADRVSVDPDRRYLIVPRVDRKVDTIPWDAIRQPKALLDGKRKACNALSAALRRVREEAGLSQTAAAQRSGLTRQTIIRLEKAGHYPGLATLDALAAAYGVKTKDLLVAAQQEAT